MAPGDAFHRHSVQLCEKREGVTQLGRTFFDSRPGPCGVSGGKYSISGTKKVRDVQPAAWYNDRRSQTEHSKVECAQLNENVPQAW